MSVHDVPTPECTASSLRYDRSSDSVRVATAMTRPASKDDDISTAGEEEDQSESSTDASGGQGAPAVVAVMVASDPGDWFETTLESLGSVEYDNFAVLVIDNAGSEDLASRIASIIPSAFVKTLDSDRGFSAAANQVLTSVEGAAFYLFLHDDIALAPDAVTEMVAEAFRSNAGIVGPKMVDWDDHRVLRSVGTRVDPFGFSSSISEPGELDQAQHDTAREVFAVSDAAVLVRADLFDEIGGFDADIPFFGEAVDLCWRAHLVGASVVFAPSAIVAHRERFDERRRVTNRQRLEIRHEARTMLRNYSLRRLLWITPIAFVLSVVELLGSAVMGKFDRSVDIAAAWFWNLGNLPSLVASRRKIRRIRRVPDRDYMRLMRQGSSRLRNLVRGGDRDHAFRSLASSGRGYIREARSRSRRGGVMLFLLAIVLLAYGSRGLIFGVLPSLREIPTLGRSGGRMVAEWFHGWREVGLGEPSVGPSGVPIAGVLSWLLFGSVSAARRLLIIGSVLIGVVGAWKLLGNRVSTASRAAVLTGYSLSPVILGAVGGGRFAAMVTYAVAPWALRLVARGSRVAPFADDASTVESMESATGPSSDRAVSYDADGPSTATVGDPWRSAAVLGLLFTVVGSFTVLGMFLIVDILLITGVVVAVMSNRRGGLHMLWLTAIGGIGALLVLSPWLYTALRHGDASTLTGLFQTATPAPSVSRIITGSVGSVRSGALGWGLVIAAVLPLAVARASRLAWSVAAWIITLTAWLGAVLVASAGGFGGSGLELLLIPATLGIALALGMGVLSFEEDVLGRDFGVQQILATGALVAGLVGLIPIVIATTDGRWFQPAGDFDAALEPLDATGGFRTLWIGDADVIPVAGWMLGDSGLALGTSVGLDPTLSDRHRSDGGDGVALLTEVIEAAIDGQTSRLGRVLGPMGIRYVVVVDRSSPVPFSREQVPMPASVVNALQSQLDLVSIDVNPAMATFRVENAWPLRSADEGDIDGDLLFATGSDSIRAQLWASSSAPEAVLGRRVGTKFRGDVPDGSTVIQATTGDPGWTLTADGNEVQRSGFRGWAQMFDIGEDGSGGGSVAVRLAWRTPLSFRLLQLVQLAALVVMVALVGLRGRRGLRVSAVTSTPDGDGDGALVSIGPDGLVAHEDRVAPEDDRTDAADTEAVAVGTTDVDADDLDPGGSGSNDSDGGRSETDE